MKINNEISHNNELGFYNFLNHITSDCYILYYYVLHNVVLSMFIL